MLQTRSLLGVLRHSGTQQTTPLIPFESTISEKYEHRGAIVREFAIYRVKISDIQLPCKINKMV